jgi:hypothetical protein
MEEKRVLPINVCDESVDRLVFTAEESEVHGNASVTLFVGDVMVHVHSQPDGKLVFNAFRTVTDKDGKFVEHTEIKSMEVELNG